MSIYLSEPNGKLRKTDKANGTYTVSFDIPAGITCPYAGICQHEHNCYASASRFNISKKKAYSAGNYEHSRTDSFVPDMISMINDIVAKKKKKVRVRIHASGDFYSIEYMSKWYAIARAIPNVDFYAYTKSVRFYHALKSIQPANIIIAVSTGGKSDIEIDPSDTIAHVFKTREDAIAHGYDVAINDNDYAMSTSKRLGLVYHGVKKWENTDWGNVPIIP